MSNSSNNNNYTLEHFKAAERHIRSAGLTPTYVKRSTWLSNASGANVFLKLDMLQVGNSFKLRGAMNYLLSYYEQHKEFPKQIVTASGGNHGIAVAVACHQLKVPCTVLLPYNSYNEQKRAILEDFYGAKVVIEGECFQDASNVAHEMAKTEGVCYIHPFDDAWVVQGQGTMYLELEEQFKALGIDIDAIVASLGGGGLLSGLIEACRASGNTKTQFFSVETRGADYYYQSHLQGHLVTLPEITSIAKTLGASTATEEIFQRFEKEITTPIAVHDPDVVESIFQLLDTEKLLVEPSCACVVTALLKNPSLFKGKNVVLVICGGNTTIEECIEWKRQFFPMEY